MKVAPVLNALSKSTNARIDSILVHTGQHYDYEMSQVFFQELELPKPDIYLGVGSGTHAEQTGKVLIEIEKTLLQEKPDLVLVVGDVNSTLAASIAAAKLNIPVAHVEAGLRSFDRTMPEEINRLLTDAISSYLFTHSPEADENLKKEGVEAGKIHFVGNVMVDSLMQYREKAANRNTVQQLGLERNGYALLTLHRPANVDEKDVLEKILDALRRISERIPVIFPAHPRTQKRIKEFDMNFQSVMVTSPLGYLDFMNLEMNAKLVMTDSGGIQEETTVLNIPCLTLRENTERPVTVTKGTNIIVGTGTKDIIDSTFKILDGSIKSGSIPDMWDGKAADRIVNIIINAGL